MRSTIGPSVIGRQPPLFASEISRRGEIAFRPDEDQHLRGLFLSARRCISSSTFLKCRESGWSDAISIRSNFGFAWKKSFGDCGRWISGSQFCPHCFAASMANLLPFVALLRAFACFVLDHRPLREQRGDCRCAELGRLLHDEVHVLSPSEFACASVIWLVSGADFASWMRRRSTECLLVAAISTVASDPLPLNTTARSPSFKRRDIQRMVRLGFVEFEGVEVPVAGGDVKTVHDGKNDE